MMKEQRRWLILLLSVLISLTFTACGTIDISVETPTAVPDDVIEPEGSEDTAPIEVLVARGLALFYVRDNYPNQSPPADLEWSERRITSEGLIGSSKFEFTSGDWIIVLSYPVTAPDSTIYIIQIDNPRLEFQWQGEVSASGDVIQLSGPSQTIEVIGWRGHIVSMPESGMYDDYIRLHPEGIGEFGVTGSTSSLEEEIVTLRDASGPNEYVHVWGTLNCEAEDYNGCQLVVTQLRYGASTTDPESVDGWEGTLTTGTFNMGIGYVFVLSGEFPMQFSIHSTDEALQGQIEMLARDLQSKIKVWGELMTGVMDINGSRITLTQIEVLESSGILEPPPTEVAFDPTADWQTFTNANYNYQIKYPLNTMIVHSGVDGFLAADLPEGMTEDEYLAQLQETYGMLCVSMTTGLGYINISAPPNEGFRYSICGRTGVGVGELVDKTENIEVNGTIYEANGFEFIGTGETLDEHNETMIVILDDGTRIEYGSNPMAAATYEDYLMKGKEVLLLILSTYTQLP